MKIDKFEGEYYFLSNFYNSDVEYNGHTFKNNEAAFQAQLDIGLARYVNHKKG